MPRRGAQGHEVEILDVRIDPDIDAAFNRVKPHLVGITGFTSHLNIVRNPYHRTGMRKASLHV